MIRTKDEMHLSWENLSLRWNPVNLHILYKNYYRNLILLQSQIPRLRKAYVCLIIISRINFSYHNFNFQKFLKIVLFKQTHYRKRGCRGLICHCKILATEDPNILQRQYSYACSQMY